MALLCLLHALGAALNLSTVTCPRRVPHHVVEEKQRSMERVRHLLLYDPTGAREDAFTMILRTLIEQLVTPLYTPS